MKWILIFLAVFLTFALGIAGYAVWDSEPDFLYYAGYVAAVAPIPLLLFFVIKLLRSIAEASAAMASAAREKQEKARLDKEVAKAKNAVELERVKAIHASQMAEQAQAHLRAYPPPPPPNFSSSTVPGGLSNVPPVSSASTFAPAAYNRIGFGLRFGALLLDMSVLLFVSGLVFAGFLIMGVGMAAYLGGNDSETIGHSVLGSLALAYVVMQCLGFLYWLSEAIWGASPGKKILGLQIVSENGQDEKKRLYLRFWWKNSAQLLVFVSVIILAVFSQGGLLWHVGMAVRSFSGAWAVVLSVGLFFIFRMSRQTVYDQWSRTIVVRARR